MQIRVKTIVRARKEKVIKKKDGRLEIHVKEKAEKGAANTAAKMLLAEYFEVLPDAVRLVRGATMPNKVFDIRSL